MKNISQNIFNNNLKLLRQKKEFTNSVYEYNKFLFETPIISTENLLKKKVKLIYNK